MMACIILIGAAGGMGLARQDSLFRQVFGFDLDETCGLHKLDEEEYQNLENAIDALLRSSALGDSAVEYLKREGWEMVEVEGTERMQLEGDVSSEEYTFVKKGFATYILKPKSYSPLLPGKYLGKMGYLSCDIIGRNGTPVGFWTKKTL